DFQRVLRLLTHKDTVELHERQLNVLRRICKTNHRGFRYRDLGFIEELIPLVAARVASGDGRAGDFRTVLIKLIGLCSLAPVPVRANEGITEWGLAASSSLLRALEGALWSVDEGVQLAAAKALQKIACGSESPTNQTPGMEVTPATGITCDDLRPSSRNLNQALLLECGVVSAAVSRLDATLGELLANLALVEESSAESTTEDGRLGDGASGAVEKKSQPYGRKKGTNDSLITDRPAEAKSRAAMYEVLLSVLNFIRELSSSAASASIMVEARLISLLVQVFHVARGIRDEALAVAVEIAWNCLEHSQEAMDRGPPGASRTELISKARKCNAAFSLCTPTSMLALRDVLEALLVNGFRIKDKELRNEVVIITSQVARNSRSHKLFRTTGMLQVLLLYATAAETGLTDSDLAAVQAEAKRVALSAGDPPAPTDSAAEGEGGPATWQQLGPMADPRNFATMAEVDLELKLLLWSLLADLAQRDSRNLAMVRESPLVETLLMYMDLVVEEGPAADDLQTAGMNRSISLASMPPPAVSVGGGRALGPTGPLPGSSKAGSTPGDREDESKGRDESLETDSWTLGSSAPQAEDTMVDAVLTREPPPSFPGGDSRGEPGEASTCPSSCGAKQDARMPPPGHQGEGNAMTIRSGEQEGGGEGGRNGAVTQLYVPTMVVRLPVTSIQVLQAQAIASLLVLAPRCPRKFQALGGHIVTLRLLERLGSCPEHRRLVVAATKLLATVVALPGLREELGRMEGVRIMLERFADNALAWEDVRADTIVILCQLCDGSPPNQEAFRQADGIPVMMNAIKEYTHVRSEIRQQGRGRGGGGSGSNGPPTTSMPGGGSGGGHGSRARAGGSTGAMAAGASVSAGGSIGGAAGQALSLGGGGSSFENIDPTMVHVVDCLWCAVIGNRRSEARLLQSEGLDTLLDLLELCPAAMQHQVGGGVRWMYKGKRGV
ncbi:unnamed protein product, partial [Discosporangium mesarthrocarpum]